MPYTETVRGTLIRVVLDVVDGALCYCNIDGRVVEGSLRGFCGGPAPAVVQWLRGIAARGQGQGGTPGHE